MKLGTALVKEGIITPEQLEEALRSQVIFGGKLGTNLVELGYIDEDALAYFLSDRLSFPFADTVELEQIPPEIIELVSRDLAERYRVLPVKREGDTLFVLMHDPTAVSVIDDLAKKTGLIISPMVASEIRLFNALENYYQIHRDVRYITIGSASDDPLTRTTEELEALDYASKGKLEEAGLTTESGFVVTEKDRAPAEVEGSEKHDIEDTAQTAEFAQTEIETESDNQTAETSGRYIVVKGHGDTDTTEAPIDGESFIESEPEDELTLDEVDAQISFATENLSATLSRLEKMTADIEKTREELANLETLREKLHEQTQETAVQPPATDDEESQPPATSDEETGDTSGPVSDQPAKFDALEEDVDVSLEEDEKDLIAEDEEADDDEESEVDLEDEEESEVDLEDEDDIVEDDEETTDPGTLTSFVDDIGDDQEEDDDTGEVAATIDVRSDAVRPMDLPDIAPPPMIERRTEDDDKNFQSDVLDIDEDEPTDNLDSLYEVGQRLEKVETRDEIAEIILRFVTRKTNRAALFVLKRSMVQGWDGSGEGLSKEKVSHIKLPSSVPSIFKSVLDRGDPYFGPMPDQPVNDKFLNVMGGVIPENVFVLPIKVRDRTISFLYADNGEAASLSRDEIEDLYLIDSKISAAFERLITRRKQAVMSDD